MSWDDWKVSVPVGSSGDWEVRANVAPYIDPEGNIVEGSFTELFNGDVLVMRDTPDEVIDVGAAVDAATGDVLVIGLGLGMVVKQLLLKPEVTSVTVVEKSADVISLVGPTYPGITIINEDVHSWSPAGSWDFCWVDIHNSKSPDNAAELATIETALSGYCSAILSWGLPA